MEITVLGAGMVGTCTALHLAQRGHAVTLVDRCAPGRETSYGNAGIIQREAVEPYAFPRDIDTLWRVATGGGMDVHYHLNALPALLPRLWRYWYASAPQRYGAIAQAYSQLIAHCLDEHQALITASGADDLVQRQGYRQAYRTRAAFEDAALDAERAAQRYGVRYAVEDSAALARAETGLRTTLAGAVHWLDPWSVSDPGELVSRYARHFQALGGRCVEGDAATLQRRESGWQVQTAHGTLTAQHAVIALGPWSDGVLRHLGYRLPLFIKRGYHQHFTGGPGLRQPLLDAERGFVLAPMAQGIRLTTGAEFARLDTAPTPVQLALATRAARELIDLPQPVETQAWLGNRPCMADMTPVIGAAPRHPGLWFNFGHGHQGFTLGPISGRLLADLLEGATPPLDPTPYRPSRF